MGGLRPSRRALLIGAGALGIAAAGIGAGASADPEVTTGRSSAGRAPVLGHDTHVERVYSRSRRRPVHLVTFRPSGSNGHLPVCLLLHGLHGNAIGAAPPGLVGALGQGVARGSLPPFAFVALDGGDSYWHARPADDPMGMLLNEVPGWLADRGLGDADGMPFACAGVSMGGFGALLYARRRNERHRPVSAVAAISPGLLMSWRAMSTRHAFTDVAQWASLDPRNNVAALGTVPVGV